MLLQRCTKDIRTAGALAALLLLGACAGSGQPKSSDSNSRSSVPAAAADGDQVENTIPAAALTLFEQAASSMAGGDLLDAELRFKEFLLQYPGYPGAYVNLAIIHANNENDAAARAAIDAALQLQPNHPAALNQLGMLLRRNGNFLEAEAAYLKAVTVSPDYALAHYNLGVLNELYLQRLDQALRHFEAYQAIVGEDKQVEKWIVGPDASRSGESAYSKRGGMTDMSTSKSIVFGSGIMLAMTLATFAAFAQEGIDDIGPAVDTSTIEPEAVASEAESADDIEPAVDTSAPDRTLHGQRQAVV